MIGRTVEVDLLGTELDPPLPDPPVIDDGEQVLTRAFASARRGFDRKQVDDFLDAAASRLKTLEKELDEARQAAGEARKDGLEEPPVEAKREDVPDDGLHPRLRSLIEVLERETASMLAQARTEAAKMIQEARDEAAKLRADAQTEAGRSIEEARASLEQADEEARRMLGDISARRQQMLEGLQQMQERLMGAVQDLDDTLNPSGLRGDDSP